MPRTFSEAMSALRREQGLSQRKAASELHISQALLGRTDEPGGAALKERLRSLSKELRAMADSVESIAEDGKI